MYIINTFCVTVLQYTKSLREIHALMYNATMSNIVEKVIAKIPARKLAQECGIHVNAVYGWKNRNQISAKHVGKVSRITGIPLRELRPSLFES